jgi:hypothetical protein
MASPLPPLAAPLRRAGEPAAALDPPLPTWLAVVSVSLFTVVAVLGAAIEVLLVPLRLGSTIVPVSVALAALGIVIVPVLSRRAVPATAAALLPAVAWVATVIALSQARPEGDVLLLGAPSALAYVTYALLGVGIVTAMVTVLRGQARGVERVRGQARGLDDGPRRR